MTKTKPQVMIVGDKEWHCTCTPCYNCRVAMHKMEAEGGPSKEEKAAADSMAPVVAAREYRASIEAENAPEPQVTDEAIHEAYVRVKPELDRLAAHDRGEIEIKPVDLHELGKRVGEAFVPYSPHNPTMPEGDPMEKMVCDSCQ